jgi:hypothetical protein
MFENNITYHNNTPGNLINSNRYYESYICYAGKFTIRFTKHVADIYSVEDKILTTIFS